MRPPLVELDGVTCRYGAAARAGGRRRSTIGAGEFIGIVGPVGLGQDDAAARCCSAPVSPARGTVTRRAGLRVGYVPQVETVNWSFPVTVGRDAC